MEIVHEIQTRMKFFNAASKKRLTLRLASPYIDTLEGLRASQSRRLTPGHRISNSSSSSNAPSASSGLARAPESIRETILISRVSKKTLNKAQMQLFGDKSGLKLMTQINSYLLDRSHEEAKVLKNFIENFDSLEKNPKTCAETARNFLNSLKERIMDVRYNQLLEVAPAHTSTIESQEDSIAREVELCIEKASLLKLHDRIMDVLYKQHKKDDVRIDQQIETLKSKPQSYFGIPSGLEASSRWQVAVIELNEIGTFFLPQEKLRAILSCIAAIVDTAQFESDRRAREAASKSRSTYHYHNHPSNIDSSSAPNTLSISPASPSSSSPSNASAPPATSGSAPAAASSNSTSPGPAEHSTAAIYSALAADSSDVSSTGGSLPAIDEESSQATNQASSSASSPPVSLSPQPTLHKPVDLSADDLLPILIYVIVHSTISRLESQCQYMWQMSDPADLVGESGYYLTMFSSAIEYLKQHEEEVAPPASSLPVSISGPSSTHMVQLFDDSDSDSDDGMLDLLPMTPPGQSSNATHPWLPNSSPPVHHHNAPNAWIGPKSYPIDPSSGTISAVPAGPTASSLPPGSPTAYSRNNRNSVFVIGSTRGGSGVLISSPHRPTGTTATGTDSSFHGSPPALSTSGQSSASGSTADTSPATTLQRENV